jgi:hypothetical protein
MFIGDYDMVKARGKVSILLETRVKGRARSIRMHDRLYVPDLHLNLLTANKFILRGL